MLTVWISADETWRWARRSGHAWPCSELEGRRIRASFDSCGLLELAIDGRDGVDVPSDELNACLADHLAGRLEASHPCWFVAVGQFGGVDR